MIFLPSECYRMVLQIAFGYVRCSTTEIEEWEKEEEPRPALPNVAPLHLRENEVNGIMLLNVIAQ
ncbi:MAG: hypothetical protein AB7H80_00775 [Candidatus Kapaibacterium sp.]